MRKKAHYEKKSNTIEDGVQAAWKNRATVERNSQSKTKLGGDRNTKIKRF
jgi:hypothetical protein